MVKLGFKKDDFILDFLIVGVGLVGIVVFFIVKKYKLNFVILE